MNFIKSIFSEADGTGSWARIASSFALLAAIGWVTYLLVRHPEAGLPPLLGPTGWVSTLYTINKAQAYLTGKANGSGNGGPPPQEK